MKWLGLVVWMMAFTACSNNKQEEPQDEEEEATFDYSRFSDRFAEATLPYQLTDTGLLKNTDTSALRNVAFTAFIPDSINQKLIGKGRNIKYIPIAKIEVPKGESY